MARKQTSESQAARLIQTSIRLVEDCRKRNQIFRNLGMSPVRRSKIEETEFINWLEDVRP